MSSAEWATMTAPTRRRAAWPAGWRTTNGSARAESLQTAAADVDVVLLCLRNPDAVSAVVFDDGLLAAMLPALGIALVSAAALVRKLHPALDSLQCPGQIPPGQMKFRQFAKTAEARASAPREAQIMMRHPNNSGLQRDQVTLLTIPAHFVDELSVWQGDSLLFSMVGGISISEDPNFRFNFVPNGAAAFRVEAKDTDGKTFRQEWPATEM